jgi:hypothetical protein
MARMAHCIAVASVWVKEKTPLKRSFTCIAYPILGLFARRKAEKSIRNWKFLKI